MSTDVPIEAIRNLIASISGVPTTHVVWSGEEEPAAQFATNKAGQLTLDVVARESIGQEEMRYTFDVPTQTQAEEWRATRVLTISIRADNFLGLGEAFDLLEKIRMRLLRRSSGLALRAVGCSFQDAVSITPLDYTVDNRAISAASLDVRIMQTITDSAAEDEPAIDQSAWIEKVSSKAEEDIVDVDDEPQIYLPFPRS